MSNIFFVACAIAGSAILWRNWIADHPTWKSYIKDNLKLFGKALLCGSCLTYWFALLVVGIYNPFQGMFAPQSAFGKVIFFVSSWMALAYLSVFLRFLYVLIQETVHYFVHHINGENHYH